MPFCRTKQIMTTVSPNEISRRLGITGLQFRTWLRDKWRAGDPRLANHRIDDRWSFSAELAAELEAEYRIEKLRKGRPDVSDTKGATAGPRRASEISEVASSGDSAAGHRIKVTVDGQQFETLADLLRPGLMAVVVGINPAPISVAAGHYWQGRTGATLWRRLRSVGLLPEGNEFQDDIAFDAGLGFTDVVKRPTRKGDEVTRSELQAGRAVLEAKLTDLEVPLIIFVFMAAATTLLGQFSGNGFVHGRGVGGGKAFVMPGPYESNTTAKPTLETLAAWVSATRGT